MTDNALAGKPRHLLGAAPMTVWQILALVVCVGLNAIDGFDVLSISFAAPGIAREWSITRAMLGVVLSFELFGMAVGSVVLGQLADRLGRRVTVIACLALMAGGMAATARVDSLTALAATRLITGLGIGGMLAVTNALVAEYANDRWRAAAVSTMAAGYPLGGIVGGALAAIVLENGGWRGVFALGAAITMLLLPLVLLLLPEPADALIARRHPPTLARVNAALARLGHGALAALPAREARMPAIGMARLFAPDLRWLTVLLTLAYFAHILTFYFIIKWVPKIVADMGHSPADAARVLMWSSLGGMIGALVFSALSLALPLRRMLIAWLCAAWVMVSYFGQPHDTLAGLAWAAGLAGFCANAGVVGLYALVAASFPSAVRGGGSGFVIGVGRGGAALGPVLSGLLFAAGLGLPVVAALMASGALLAALALIALGRIGQP